MENHILLIDDDEDECLLLQMALQHCPKPSKVHQVLQFNEAVTFAETFQLTPNLIFLDLRLPEMPGLEILTWIRNHKRLMNVPVVIWSHTASDNDLEQIHLHGGNYFLSKIADQDSMHQSVKHICDSWLR